MFRKAGLVITFILMAMLFAFYPTEALAAGPSEFSDMPAAGYWSHDALTSAVENNLLNGSDGRLTPRANLTRAQLAAVINRAFGAVEEANLAGFSDIPAEAWYASDMAKAVMMKTFQGDNTGRLRPEDTVTRQEAFAVIARAFKLPAGDPAALNRFSDRGNIDAWAVTPLAALTEGYIQGEGGMLHPKDPISREEFAKVMYNIVGTYVSAPGAYTRTVSGNVTVNAPGVTLKGLTVAGDLIIGDGVRDGDVVLDNVTVTGRLVVRGGGEDSIRLINKSNVGSISVGKTGSGGIRILAEEGCQVEMVYVDDGVDDIILEGVFNNVSIETSAPVMLRDASVTALTIFSASSSVKLDGSTTVTVAKIDGSAVGASVDVGKDSKVAKVESAAESVSIRGSGTVVEAVISGNDTAVDIKGVDITVSEGAKGVTSNGNNVSGSTSPATGGGGGGSDNSGHAATAATYAELAAALADVDVTSITITGTIQITGNVTVTFNKPITVSESHTASIEVHESARLINVSTLTSLAKEDGAGIGFDTGVRMAGGTFENRGTFINNSRFGDQGAFINTATGTVTLNDWFHCFDLDIENSGTFNIPGGTLALHPLGQERSIFTNTTTGRINATGTAVINILPGCSLVNSGTITTGTECSIENYGTLTNNGSFTNQGSVFNAGLINGSVGIIQDTGAQITNMLAVANETGLRSALSGLDAAYSGIIIMDDIELENNLTINKRTEIYSIADDSSATLTVPSGKTLTVAHTADAETELMVRGELAILSGGGLVTTTNGLDGVNELYGQVTVNGGGSLTAQAGSSINNEGRILLIDGTIDIDDDANFAGRPWDDAFRRIEAETFDDLTFALSEDRCETVELTAGLTLSGNITLNKDMTVRDGVTLTVPNNRNFTVGGGGSVKMLGALSIAAGGTLINEGFIHVGGTFSNAGEYLNDVDSRFEAQSGSIINTGTFVNNSRMEFRDATLDNLSAGRFITNGIGGLFFAEGSVINTPAEFHNAGYMKVVDEYKAEGRMAVTFEDLDGLTDDSGWIDYTASVYDPDCLTAAIQAQEEKTNDPDQAIPAGLRSYCRLDFAISIDLPAGETRLDDFSGFWAESYWDEINDLRAPVVLTVPVGASLIVGPGSTLFITEGEVVNEGSLTLSNGTAEEGAGNVDVWVDGTFTNNGAVHVNTGIFCAQEEYEDDGSGDLAACATINGASISGLIHSAKVYDWEGLRAAALKEEGSEKYYARIEIKDERDIVLEDSLDIEAGIFLEWASGIEVPEGKVLNLIGGYKTDNSGDIWVYGTVTTGAGYEFENSGNLQVGSGSEGDARFENGGAFSNLNRVEVWLGGGFYNTGTYNGDVPDDSNGGTVSGITP